MSLKQQIQNNLTAAQKAKNELLVSTLRLLTATIKNAEIDKRAKKPSFASPFAKATADKKATVDKKAAEGKPNEPELTDDEIITVINKEVKQRKDSIAEYEKGGRADLADKEKQELEILQKYLPEQLSEDQAREIVKKVIADAKAGPEDFGKIMSQVMAQVKGRADGNLVSKILKEELAS